MKKKGQRQLVIGLVGENGAGKGTCLGVLKSCIRKRRFADHRFSDVLRETLDLWYLEKTRKNQQTLPVIMRNGYGDPNILTRVVEMRTRDSFAAGAHIVLIDGIRWMEDYTMLRSFPDNILLYVTAPAPIRYRRLKERKEKTGEEMMPWEQFQEEEKAENELLVPEIGRKADSHPLVNDGTQEGFRRSVVVFYKKNILPRLG